MNTGYESTGWSNSLQTQITWYRQSRVKHSPFPGRQTPKVRQGMKTERNDPHMKLKHAEHCNRGAEHSDSLLSADRGTGQQLGLT